MRLFAVSLLCLLLWAALPAAQAAEQEKGAKWIFKSGQTPLMSNYLRAGMLPVYVLIDGKRLPGLYITTPTGGLSAEMGLKKGAILLSIDGYSMASAPVLDQWLRRRPVKPLDFTYVTLKDGAPQVASGQIAYKGTGTASGTLQYSSGSASSGAGTAGSGSPDQHFSTAELESLATTLINDSRHKEGRAAVSTDPALSRLAQGYADYMLQHCDQYGYPLKRNPHIDLEGRFPMQRAWQAGIFTEVHENLGMETRGKNNDSDLVRRQHGIMMSEPPGMHNHRSILLDENAHKLGVGIARDEKHLFLVEEFGH